MSAVADARPKHLYHCTNTVTQFRGAVKPDRRARAGRGGTMVATSGVLGGPPGPCGPRVGALNNRPSNGLNSAPDPDPGGTSGAHGVEEAREAPLCHVIGRCPGGRLSKSVAKARIAPERWKRIVGVPRFFSPPIPARDVFATDLDNRPPRVVPEAPPVPLRSRLTRTMSKSDPSEELRGATTPRAGELTRRTCVCYALFPLLRSFTLRCTRKRSVAEGEGA